jgi:hypothetical protein
MEIMQIVMIVIIGFVVLAIGGGIGFWLWIATKTKKMTWKAKVYQKSDGTIDVDGKYILDELKPYTQDIVEKIDKKNGATHYWLQKMKKAVPVVTADCVEVWPNSKEVKILLDGDTCTLLKSGYDDKIGVSIFRPIPHDRINMIKTELSVRKERVQEKKDILSAIAPYVTIGISMIALVICIYLVVQGGIKASEQNLQGSIVVGESVSKLSNAMLTVYGYDTKDLNSSDTREVNRESPPIPP